MAEVSSAPTRPDTFVASGESEQELILRAQRYEAEPLAELFEAHFDDVYRYVYGRVGDHGMAEDLTRQVFIRALEGLPKFRRFAAGFAPWLYRIANSLLAPKSEDRARAGAAPEPLPADAPEAARLRIALRSLTADQQEVLSLRFIAGLPANTVAAATGHRLSHVLALQHRALVGLRRALNQPTERSDAG